MKCSSVNIDIKKQQQPHYLFLVSFIFHSSVCNWPWASAPCEDVTTAAPEIDTTEESGSGDGEEGEVTTAGTEIDAAEENENDNEDDDTIVVVAPTFGFECANAGLFPHETNCKKFWLCKGILLRL